MADLLTHVLFAYVLTTGLSIRYEWITPPLVTVAMMGAMIPDLSRGSLLVPDGTVAAVLDVPFAWFGFHTIGGCAVAILIGAVLIEREHRMQVLVLLMLGAGSHLFLDGLLVKPSGYAAPMLWPLTDQRPPTPGLYLSSDRWPAAVGSCFAVAIWFIRYRIYD